jgi:hypothetical protein
MSLPKDKKERERCVLDCFLSRTAIKADAIEPADPPDFFLTIGDNRVGVELVRLFQPHSRAAVMPAQARENYEDQIVERACQIHAEAGGPPLWVSVFWVDRSGPNKASTSAQSVRASG